MKKIMAFVTKDGFVTPTNTTTSQVYEMSDISQTYSKTKSIYYSPAKPEYCLSVYSSENDTGLTQAEIDSIIKVVSGFNDYLTTTMSVDNLQNRAVFTNSYNSTNSLNPVTGFNYNLVVEGGTYRVADYLYFTVADVLCQVWCKDDAFKVFYPDYDVDPVMPFDDFNSVVLVPANFINALQNFNLIDFVTRLNAARSDHNCTTTRVLNIPYKIPGSNVLRDCYFGFNIYGIQGNFEHILKLELYDYLTNVVGIPGPQVEELFPSILSINEFFIVPRWDNIAIPTQVGQLGINGQINSTYSKVYDTNKFIKVIADQTFIENNTYNVPVEYNNIMLEVTNGLHSEASVKDFKQYYPDFLSVSSSSVEFSRMTLRTQRFLTMLENMLYVADSKNQAELFSRLVTNTDFRFSLITRNTVTYISILFEDHQYYLVPKYVAEILNT